MPAYLMAGIDLDRIGGLAVIVDDSATGSPTEFRITTGTFAHRDLSFAMGAGEYVELCNRIEADVNAVMGATHTVSFNVSTLNVEWTCTSDFTLQFSTGLTDPLEGLRLRAALGMAVTSSTLATVTLVSPYRPYYVLELARDGLADYSEDYEPGGMVERAVSVSGQGYSIQPTAIETLLDFKLKLQSKASMFSRHATTAEPWTMEHLVKHCRAHDPILHSYSVEDMVGKLVPPSAEWTKDMRTSIFKDYQALWDISLNTQVIGRI